LGYVEHRSNSLRNIDARFEDFSYSVRPGCGHS
jgi:hypothetical protein